MDLLDWALLALVALAFGLALYKTIDNKRRGKSCGGFISAGSRPHRKRNNCRRRYPYAKGP